MESIDLSDVSSLERKMLEYQYLKERALARSYRYNTAIGLCLGAGFFSARSFYNDGINFESVGLLCLLGWLIYDFYKENIGTDRHAAAIALDEWLEEEENDEY